MRILLESAGGLGAKLMSLTSSVLAASILLIDIYTITYLKSFESMYIP